MTIYQFIHLVFVYIYMKHLSAYFLFTDAHVEMLIGIYAYISAQGNITNSHMQNLCDLFAYLSATFIHLQSEFSEYFN